MMHMELDNGVLCSYEQCHYTPDVWRNYTIIGTEGRLENFNDRPGEAVIRVWNRRTVYNPYGDEQHFIPKAEGEHGGADPVIMAEFLRFVREGGKTETSPIAARASVAAGCLATHSLRHGGIPCAIPPLDPKVIAYFQQQP
jgi:predicted dehydrogenase